MAVTLTTTYQLISQDYVGDAYGAVWVKCYAKYNRQEVANNRTEITVATNLSCAGTWWSQNGNEWYAGATGLTTASGTAPANYSPGEITLGTLTGWITHNNDGTKTLDVSSGFVSTPWGFAKTTTGNVILPTIPRASKLNSASMSIASNGSSITITPNMTKNVSTYYDSLTVKNGNTNLFTIDGVTHNTAKSLTSAQITAVYNAIGTATTKTLTCYLTTYTNSSKTTTIGTSSSVNLVATLPSYSLSFTTSSVVDSVTTYDTYKPTTNTFITNLSKPTYTFSASSSTGTTYGRSIGYTIGSTSVTSPYTNNNYTGQSLTITASDGRKSVNSTPSMTHVAYFRPTLTTKVKRPTPTGSTATVTVNGTYYDGTNLTNLETPVVQFAYTESGGTQQTITIPITTSTSGTTISFTGTAQLTGLDYKKTVSWNSIISDILNITTTNTGTLVEGLPLWNGYKKNEINYFNVNGKINNQSNGNDMIEMKNSTSNTDTMIMANCAWNNRKIAFGVGAGGVNRGIFDLHLNKWAVYSDDTNVYLNGNSQNVTQKKSLTSKSHSNYGTNNGYLPDMSFIAYWNGAYNSSNASNLTYAHQGTIQCKPDALYTNASGNGGTVSLSATSGNYSYLEILFFNTISSEYKSLRVYSPNGKSFRLNHIDNESNTVVRTFHTKYTISGTSITKGVNYYSYIINGGTLGTVTNTNYFKIVQVLGWK